MSSSSLRSFLRRETAPRRVCHSKPMRDPRQEATHITLTYFVVHGSRTVRGYPAIQINVWKVKLFSATPVSSKARARASHACRVPQHKTGLPEPRQIGPKAGPFTSYGRCCSVLQLFPCLSCYSQVKESSEIHSMNALSPVRLAESSAERAACRLLYTWLFATSPQKDIL